MRETYDRRCAFVAAYKGVLRLAESLGEGPALGTLTEIGQPVLRPCEIKNVSKSIKVEGIDIC